MERLIREIEWETPLNRVNTETGLLMIRMHIGRGELPMAYSHCHRLLHVAEDSVHRPELLYCLADVCRAMGRDSEAAAAVTTLMKEHPYSEATARAGADWGAAPPPRAGE